MSGMADVERKKTPVAVLGATGSVGQRFVALLAEHPWFELVALAASEKNVGRPYGEAVRWVQASPLPARAAAMRLSAAEPPLAARIAFSALDADVAGPIETAFARSGAFVVSNAKSHRMDPDVPLLVPEVNPDHLELVARQDFPRGGALVTNPNCSTIGLVLALAPLARAFGVPRAHVVTMQAVSGAGLPGVPSMEILDNLIPFIAGEEEKLESEPKKILGRLRASSIDPATLTISAQCNRVAVLDGHTECVSLELARSVDRAEILAAWRDFRSEPQERSLPSAPARVIHYQDDPAAPQPRRHRELDGGMATVIGRLAPCPVLGWRFVLLTHNTLRGAAKGAILCAELAVARGMLD
jgi:aspartate-semialdehyde dehydrogenase